jgi:hypothetical protein
VTSGVSRPLEDASRSGCLWWLPAGGLGNGLNDRAWVPVLELSEQSVPRVLSALFDAGVPAYAALADLAAARLRDRSGLPAGWQLWVGASAYGRAETVLVTVMPSVAREAAGRHDRAWR